MIHYHSWEAVGFDENKKSNIFKCSKGCGVVKSIAFSGRHNNDIEYSRTDGEVIALNPSADDKPPCTGRRRR